MTTPGGVPNLPVGALTLDTLAQRLQDMSGTAMKERAVERFPGIMDNSTGLSPLSDFTPFGILTRIWAEVNSLIANADPADIQGPEDIPELLLEFIEGLPVVGQFVELLQAILGDYDGTDETLLAVRAIFAPIRALMQLFSGLAEGIPNVDQISDGVNKFLDAFVGLDLTNPGAVLTAISEAVGGLVTGIIQSIIDTLVSAVTGSTGTGNDVTALVALLNPVNQIRNVMEFLETIAAQLGGTSGGIDARLSALEAQVLGASGLVSADNFNRAAIGPNWTNVTGTLAIQNNDYVRTSASSAGYYNLDEPDTDRHGVAIKVVDKAPGVCRAWLCGDATMSNYAAVEISTDVVGNDYVRVITGSSPSVVVAHTEQSFSANWLGNNSLQNGDVIALRYDDVTNKYTVMRNAALVESLTWEDTTNIVTHGAGKRKVGIVSNALNQSQFPGFGLTDFVFYDWAS